MIESISVTKHTCLICCEKMEGVQVTSIIEALSIQGHSTFVIDVTYLNVKYVVTLCVSIRKVSYKNITHNMDGSRITQWYVICAYTFRGQLFKTLLA